MPPKRKTVKRKSPNDSRPSTALLNGVYDEKAFKEVEKLRKRYQERVNGIIEEGNRLLRLMLQQYADQSTAVMKLLRSTNKLLCQDINRAFDLSFSMDGNKDNADINVSVIAILKARILRPTHYTLTKCKLIADGDKFTPDELASQFPFLLIMKLYSPGILKHPLMAVATRSARGKCIMLDRTHNRRAFEADVVVEALYVQIPDDRRSLPHVFSRLDLPSPMYKKSEDQTDRVIRNRLRKQILHMPRFLLPAAILSPRYADVPVGLLATARLVFWCCRLLRKSVLSDDLVPYIMQFLIGPCVAAALESIVTPQEFLWCVPKPLPTM